MELEAVRQKLLADIPDAEVTVEGEGCNFTVTVVSEQFAGKMPVARQKMVMAPFKELIATGDIHALGVKAFTPDEKKSVLV
jgi:acid stress-induced BolA-like protein IbaG/YrbA